MEGYSIGYIHFTDHSLKNLLSSQLDEYFQKQNQTCGYICVITPFLGHKKKMIGRLQIKQENKIRTHL